MRNVFTLLFCLCVFGASHAQELLIPDSAYASSMFLNKDGLGHLQPKFLIMPASTEDVAHPYYSGEKVNTLNEETVNATHPASMGGDKAFGAWHSAPHDKEDPTNPGTMFNTPVDQQWVAFKFNEPKNLKSIVIWNIHQVNGGVPSNNDMKDFSVDASVDGATWTTVLAKGTLDDNTDASVPAPSKTFDLTGATGVTHIRINAISNYGHLRNVGLAEVRFIGEVTTGIERSSAQQVEVFVLDQSIQIRNAVVGSQYSVYNVAGALLQSGKMNGTNGAVALNQKGIYMIVINGAQGRFVQKVVVQ